MKMNKFFSHQLMENNILSKDLKEVINFLKKKNIILTQSKFVNKFENEWSKWLGVKYSVFVNSGSSANILSLAVLRTLTKKKNIIVPTLTWVSDINAVLFNGFKPIFVDINLSNLSMSHEQIKKSINKDTAAVFLTHAQGFNGLNNNLIRFLKKKKIPLIEDVCESHGAVYKNKKLGSFGLISNFSFYYAHHMSTIEGGMICTNNKKIFEISKMIRSHGMVREAGNIKFEKSMMKKYKFLSPKFIFLHQGYNFRNNEIGGLIGSSQLKRLDKNNKLRTRNFKFFLKLLNKDKYFTNYDIKGSSNYAFPIILNTKASKKEIFLKKY